MHKIQLFKSNEDEFTLVEKHIKTKSFKGSKLEIFQAGCGRYFPLNLEGISKTLTRVDIDNIALDYWKNRDLDDTILGDLRYVELGLE